MVERQLRDPEIGAFVALRTTAEVAPNREAEVRDVLRQCHGGSVGGQFCEEKKADQVRRRFY